MKHVVVTGASSGLGEALALEWAKRGALLTIAARREDRLKDLEQRLKAAGSPEVWVVVCDLTQKNQIDALKNHLREHAQTFDLLINNAGFGVFGPFEELSLDRQLECIDLNIKALVSLTYEAVTLWKEQRRGGSIIQIASTAAFSPLPYFSVYAATKSFVLNFSDALSSELKDIHCMTVCPGPTNTEFFDHAGKSMGKAKKMAMSTDDCVQRIMVAFDHKKPRVITGWTNQIAAFLGWLTPTFILRKVMGPAMRAFFLKPDAKA